MSVVYKKEEYTAKLNADIEKMEIECMKTRARINQAPAGANERIGLSAKLKIQLKELKFLYDMRIYVSHYNTIDEKIK
ncbi:MAG: hypothetical protein ACLRFG_00605 [Clostridia bacterium]